MRLKISLNIISGQGTQELASIRYPPYWDIEFGNGNKKLNWSRLDFDWEYFYNYVSVKIKDMVLEVRP